MEFFTGRRTQFNYAIEDVAYGTPNTATTWAWMGMIQKFTPSDRFEIRELDAMDDVDNRDPTDHDVLVKRYGGSLEFLPQNMRHLVLAYGDGADTKTGTAPAITHTIATKGFLSSFGIEVGFQHTSKFGIRYDGCVMNKYEIGSTKGDHVRCTADVIAKTGTKITSFKDYQASVTTLKKYTATQMRPFRHSDVTATINGVDYSYALNSWRLSMDNGSVAEPHDAVTISEPIPGLRKWSASFDLNLSVSTLWDLKETATKISGDTKVVIARTASTDDVTFTLNDPIIEVMNPPFDVKQGLVNATLSILCTSITPVVHDTLDVDYDDVCA